MTKSNLSRFGIFEVFAFSFWILAWSSLFATPLGSIQLIRGVWISCVNDYMPRRRYGRYGRRRIGGRPLRRSSARLPTAGAISCSYIINNGFVISLNLIGSRSWRGGDIFQTNRWSTSPLRNRRSRYGRLAGI